MARAEGVEAEMELPFAALHQLCGPMLNRLDRLRDALGVALGMSSGSVPGRFLIGWAVLGLLFDAAAGRPLMWPIDDAQWLDQASAQALAFVARRLDAEPVVLLFSIRDLVTEGDRVRLPGLAVGDCLTLARWWLRSSQDRWMRGSGTASSPSPAATRWPCSNSPAGRRRRT